MAHEAAREGLGVNAEALTALQSGRLHRFADWPNPEVPIVAIGLSSIRFGAGTSSSTSAWPGEQRMMCSGIITNVDGLVGFATD